MNGISLVCHYTLVFYVGVNSNGGEEDIVSGNNGGHILPLFIPD